MNVTEKAKELCSEIVNVLRLYDYGMTTEFAEAKAVEYAEALIDKITTEQRKKDTNNACVIFCDFCPHRCGGFPHDDCQVLVEYRKKMEDKK